MNNSRGIKRSLIILGVSALSITIILVFTVDERTRDALSDVKPVFLLAYLGIWLCSLVFDSCAIMMFTKGTNERIGLMAAVKTVTLRIFFNILTPFAFGGQPFSIISLSQEGIPPGKGSSIVVTKLITLSAFTQGGAILAFIFFSDQISNVATLNGIFMISGILGAAFTILLVSGFLYPQLLVKLITTAGKVLHAMRIVKDTRKLKKKAIEQASMARRSFRRYFSTHLGYFLSGTMCNGLVYVSQLVLLWFILLGLGLQVPFVKGIVLAAMLLFLITFMPTPGAIGLGEALFILLFARTVPSYLLGIALVLWRFFYHYLSALVGGISSSKFVSDFFIKKPKKSGTVSK